MSEFFGGFTSDEEQQPVRNETQLEPVLDEFKNLLTDCKRSIYTGIVFAYPEESKQAQDPSLLNVYQRSLSALYGVMNSLPNIEVNNIDWTKAPWSAIPQNAHAKTQAAVLWYDNFIRRNRSIDRIPYVDYISNVLIKHSYNQNPNPEED